MSHTVGVSVAVRLSLTNYKRSFTSNQAARIRLPYSGHGHDFDRSVRPGLSAAQMSEMMQQF